MQIELILKDLLLTNDCVIVPNFGGFVSNYKAATVKNSPFANFSPPSKHIVFNDNLKVDDGLLTNTISKEYLLQFADAKKEVENFVAATIEILDKGRSYTMEGVGTFMKTSENNIIFESELNENLLSDSFGLGDFEFAVLKNPELIRKENKKYKDLDPVRRLALKKYARAALIASPIILALLFVPKHIDTLQLSSLHFFNASPAVETIKYEMPTPTVTQDVNPIASKLDEVVQKQVALKYIEPVKSTSNNQYFIIAGSFTSTENAERLITTLREQNVEAEILTSDGYNRVYIDGFDQKENAEARLNTLRSQNEAFKSFWIYKK